MSRARAALLAAATAATGLLAAACSAAAGQSPPTWLPSPTAGYPSEGPGINISPIVPGPAPSSGGGSAGGSSPGGAPSSRPSSKVDPLVMATKLPAPVGLAVLPDGSALVGERTTGRIVRVQPRPGQPVPTVKTVSGIDPAGDGGLLDLALSPTFDQDGLVYAYLTTATDNRVVDVTLAGPGTPVLTGIPKGSSGNGGRLSFGPDGSLFVGTGTAGDAAAASDPASRAGKVLRISDIGRPAAGNPSASSPVWTRGHVGLAGVCAPLASDADSATAAATPFEVERGEVNVLARGAAYADAGARSPVATLPRNAGAAGDCAVTGGRLWVTSADRQALLSAAVTGTGTATRVGSFDEVLARRYGRLKTVVAAPDGALWLTTTNRDGHGRPVAADERVIRYVPSGASNKSGSPV